MKLNEIDYEIIKLLEKDSKMTNEQISNYVFLTPQAVSQRIKKMKDNNIIQNYTINTNLYDEYIVNIFMNSNNFCEFENFIANATLNCPKLSINLYKTQGSSCYIMHLKLLHSEDINNLLSNIEMYCRYTVNKITKNII